MQPITYRNRPVAIASAERFWLTDEIDALPTANPLKTWACVRWRDRSELDGATGVRTFR